MATAIHVSPAEFQAKYAGQGPYEYWFGKIVEKSVPTWLHAILQSLLGQIFSERGYFAGSELDLRISPDFQPRPDVAASLELESTGYPTRPVDIVAEILSPGDDLALLRKKCRYYTELGITQIYVFDPVERSAFEWNPATHELVPIQELLLTNGFRLPVAEIFARFERRLRPRPKN